MLICNSPYVKHFKNIIECLINNNIYINHLNKEGNNVLMVLLSYWRLSFWSSSIFEVIKLFVDKGINKNHVNNNGDNVLMLNYQSYSFIQLFKNHVNLNQVNKQNKTLLDILMKDNHTKKIIKALKEDLRLNLTPQLIKKLEPKIYTKTSKNMRLLIYSATGNIQELKKLLKDNNNKAEDS